MKSEAEKNKGGRPRKEVNWAEFEKLCALQATEQEIADWFEMDTNTLEARIKEKYDMRFSEVFRQKRGRGKIALRRAQWQSAIDDRNITMQIFLGKNFLGQSDKVENHHMIDELSFIDPDDESESNEE
jgi:hypothetical protein